MNYQLMANGFPAISIAKENRLAYLMPWKPMPYGGDLTLFADMVAELVEQQLDLYLACLRRYKAGGRNHLYNIKKNGQGAGCRNVSGFFYAQARR